LMTNYTEHDIRCHQADESRFYAQWIMYTICCELSSWGVASKCIRWISLDSDLFLSFIMHKMQLARITSSVRYRSSRWIFILSIRTIFTNNTLSSRLSWKIVENSVLIMEQFWRMFQYSFAFAVFPNTYAYNHPTQKFWKIFVPHSRKSSRFAAWYISCSFHQRGIVSFLEACCSEFKRIKSKLFIKIWIWSWSVASKIAQIKKRVNKFTGLTIFQVNFRWYTLMISISNLKSCPSFLTPFHNSSYMSRFAYHANTHFAMNKGLTVSPHAFI